MGSGARNYSEKTIKRLFARSGNTCAFPGCDKMLVNQSNAKDANICHIEGAKPGSERYNPKMTNAQRADYANLIVFCIQHHDETNDTERYTVEVLKEMKREHESEQMMKRISRNPSMLSNIISAAADIDFSEITEDTKLNVFDPKHKIEFNQLQRNAGIINEYKVHQLRVNALFEELETQGSVKKERLLRNINMIYHKVKGEYLKGEDSIEMLRKYSDDIFDAVHDALCEKLSSAGLWEEDIYFGVNLLLVDSFIRCKILEEPDDSK